MRVVVKPVFSVETKLSRYVIQAATLTEAIQAYEASGIDGNSKDITEVRWISSIYVVVHEEKGAV